MYHYSLPIVLLFVRMYMCVIQTALVNVIHFRARNKRWKKKSMFILVLNWRLGFCNNKSVHFQQNKHRMNVLNITLTLLGCIEKCHKGGQELNRLKVPNELNMNYFIAF